MIHISTSFAFGGEYDMATQAKFSKKDRKEKFKKELSKWIWFGVVLSCAPIFCVSIFRAISGYPFFDFSMGSFNDYFLIVFAVATNLCALAIDGIRKRISMSFSIATMVVSASGYIYFYTEKETIAESNLLYVFISLIAIIVTTAIFGTIVAKKRSIE